jgi:hypothetical protein
MLSELFTQLWRAQANTTLPRRVVRMKLRLPIKNNSTELLSQDPEKYDKRKA